MRVLNGTILSLAILFNIQLLVVLFSILISYHVIVIRCFQLALACYAQRIDLSAHGFFITPEIGFDWTTGKGIPFRYFTYGAAFSEVEIDTLTGDFHTRSANVFLDLGHSLNPAIDVGQVVLNFLSSILVLIYW